MAAPVKSEFTEIKKYAFKVLQKWYLIVISLLIAFMIAFLINKYTAPLYVIASTVLVKESEIAGSAAGGFLFGTGVSKSTRDLNNEVYLLRSKNVVKQVFDSIDYMPSYFLEGEILTTELYKSSPVHLEIDSASTRIPFGLSFKLMDYSADSFRIFTENEQWARYFGNGTYRFGNKISVQGFIFTIHMKRGNLGIDDPIIIRIDSRQALINRYAAKINVNSLHESTSIIQISVTGENDAKEIDFLNVFVQKYIENDLATKTQNFTNTINFITSQLAYIGDSLDIIEKQLETFKQKNTDINLTSKGNDLYQRMYSLETNMAQLEIKDKYLEYLENYLQDMSYSEDIIVPVAFGINDAQLSKFIEELVDIQTRLRIYDKQGPVENPLREVQLKRLEKARSNILESLQNFKNQNAIDKAALQERIQLVDAALYALPSKEREMVNIQRMYDLSENMYVFLLQKRAEAAIQRASSVSSLKLVDPPHKKGPPIRPQVKRNYIIAGLAGFAIPTALILLFSLLNQRIDSRSEIHELTDIPMVGMVGHSRSNQELVTKSTPRSSIAESFRKIRANLQYMIGKLENGKTLLITSSISGEGKTFTAINLAYIMAISGKKTLLIGADMRKPKLYEVFETTHGTGLSNYLAGISEHEDILQATNVENLFVVVGGDMPPNPSELLMNERMHKFMQKVKGDFDVILIDSPPMGLVSDSFELMKYSQANLFLVRQSYSLTHMVKELQEMYAQNKLPHAGLVFNDIRRRETGYGSYHYGYGYGYGYYSDQGAKSPWWKRIWK